MEQELRYYNKDCLDFLESVEDRSVDMICIDPPYYKVVKDKWDNQWFTVEEYYEWCEKWITEMSRTAKKSCSLWIFGFPHQLSHLLPVIEAAGWTFRQQIVVDKGLRAVAGRTSNKLKMFPTATESIFYFHYEARDYIRDLLQSERRRLNMKGTDVNKFLGKATSGGGTFACIASEKKPREHRVYPTREDWKKLQEIMDLPDYDDVIYSFNLEPRLTDVWTDINFYDRKVKKIHSTQKPEKLIERLINASSNPGDTVMDFFVGSGTTPVVCAKRGRKFIGCEMDKEYFDKSTERIENCITTLETEE